MGNCKYERIIVIGCGTIASTVMEYVVSMRKTYGYECEFVRHEMVMESSIKSICDNGDAVYREIENKEELKEFFISIFQPSLVISAGNYFIFPEVVIDNPFLTIINYHNALLPRYPGVNAPTWCIFNDEDKTGVTWHYVNKNIDAGEIIYQESCIIGKDEKAFLFSCLQD